MIYPKGSIVSGVKHMYEKLDNEDCGWWVSLTSHYIVEIINEKGEKVYELRPESDKPLYKADGSLNRFGFRWPDHQVKQYYGSKRVDLGYEPILNPCSPRITAN